MSTEMDSSAMVMLRRAGKPCIKARTLLFFLHRTGESLCASSVAEPEEGGYCRSCVTLSENDTSSILCLFQEQGLHTQHGACL